MVGAGPLAGCCQVPVEGGVGAVCPCFGMMGRMATFRRVEIGEILLKVKFESLDHHLKHDKGG